MADSTKHILAAIDGLGEPIAYLSKSKSWSNNLADAEQFASRPEAEDFLRANPASDNPGPVRAVCINQDDLNELSGMVPNRARATALYTGIYG